MDTAKLFTELAAKVKPQGMRVGYHAHGGDFKKFDGETAWDIFFSNAGPDVVMQMDIGNCLGGGGDPYAMLKKFPGRSATIHLKEHGGKPGAVDRRGRREVERGLPALRDHRQDRVVHRRAGELRRHAAGLLQALPGEPPEDGKGVEAVSYQPSAISYRLSAIGYQLSDS